MFYKKLLAFVLLTLGMMVTSLTIFAQTEQIKVSTATEPKEGEDIQIIVTPATSNLTFSKVTFYYRVPSDKYQAREMKFEQGHYTFIIPGAQAVPPTLEYYVIGTKGDGSKVIFPYIQSENPEVDVENSPAVLKVRPVSSDESVSILMGEPGSTVAAEDFIIMLSYYRISENIDVTSIKLVVNGKDVTAQATVTADALTYLPETPPAKGSQSMEFSAKLKDGTAVGPISWKTTATTVEEAAEVEEAERNFNIAGNVWDELRHESVAGGSKGYHRANGSASGNWYWLNYSTNVYMTSEEKSFLQPSNRYTLKLMTKYLDLGIGDVYPSFSRLVMNGTRVRGLESNLKLNWVNVDIAWGQTSRAVEATIVKGAEVVRDTTNRTQKDLLEQQGYILDGETYRLRTSFGDYQRDLFAAKISFGDKTDGFNYGISFLKSMDDTTSNKFGDKASANIATGMDMQLILDNNRFSWYGDVAASIRNSDIRTPLTKELKDAIGDKIDPDKYSKYFPITAGIDAPLSDDMNKILDFTALQTGLKLNYWNNYLKAEFIRYGGSYSSDGLAFFQNDVQGLKFSDRFRMLQNKLILSVGFDRLTNNLNKAKDFKMPIAPGDTITIDGTTTRKTIRTGVAVFPGGKWPSITFDFIQSSNLNELPDYAAAGADNVSNTIQISSSYGFSAGENFHSVSVTFATTNKVDNRDRAIFLDKYGISPVDQKNRSIFLSYSTTFGSDMSIGGSFANSKSEYEIAGQTTNSSIKPGDVGYGFATKTETSLNILEVNAVKTWWGKLKTGGRVNATFSDNNQYVVGGNAEYAIYQNLFATYDLNYFINTGGAENDFITALRLQYVF